MHPESLKFKKTLIKKNRLQAKEAVLKNKLRLRENVFRSARTNTLIQMGNLIKLIGLAELCGIQEGDNLDLKIYSSTQYKGYILLGILTTVRERFSLKLSYEHYESFKQKGINTLKLYGSMKFIKQLINKQTKLVQSALQFENNILFMDKFARKACTRTLIQIGTKIIIAGLSELCHIQEGDNLEKNLSSKDKAATLLGLLMIFLEQLPATLNEKQLNSFEQKGINTFKNYNSQNILESINDTYEI